MMSDVKIEQLLSCDILELSEVEQVNFYLELVDFLQDLDRIYYDNNDPQIDDNIYDKLKSLQIKMITVYPYLKEHSKYYSTVGYKPSEKFNVIYPSKKSKTVISSRKDSSRRLKSDLI